jgi:hypothetical protein
MDPDAFGDAWHARFDDSDVVAAPYVDDAWQVRPAISLDPNCICDINPNTTDGPNIECPTHGIDASSDVDPATIGLSERLAAVIEADALDWALRMMGDPDSRDLIRNRIKTLRERSEAIADTFDVIRGALHARSSHAYCTPDCDGPTDDEDADAEAVVKALRAHGLLGENGSVAQATPEDAQ